MLWGYRLWGFIGCSVLKGMSRTPRLELKLHTLFVVRPVVHI